MMNVERPHSHSVWALLVGAMCGAMLDPQAKAQCGFDWAHGFHALGLNGTVADTAVFDDGSGSGPEIYAVGPFTTAGGLSAGGIAKWDGKQWVPVDDEFVEAHCIEALPDPSGEGIALYAGCKMVVDGVASYYVAKWNGSDWAPIGGAMNWKILAIESFDDGSGAGQQLYAGGSFTTAGGVDAMAVAKWDGAAWAAVQGRTTFTGFVRALEVFDDDGSGPNAPHLYAGRVFTSPNGLTIRNIAKWDGSNWSSVGSGVWAWAGLSSEGGIYGLAVHDEDGPGTMNPALFACGKFRIAGGIEVNNIARWNGTGWSTLAGGFFLHPALTMVSDATGIIDGSPALYVGGEMQTANGLGGITVNKVARWDGKMWEPLSTGVVGTKVSALAIIDTGLQETSGLVALGAFMVAGNVVVDGFAKWNGADWSAIATSIYPPTFRVVSSLVTFADGSGEKLYVGLESLSSGPAVACYDGTSWSMVGDLMGHTRGLVVYDDGQGEGAALFAGGTFTNGEMTHVLCKWNGLEWVPIPISQASYSQQECTALCVHEVAPGKSALAAAGLFYIPSDESIITTSNHVVLWDGKSTTVLPSFSTLQPGPIAMIDFDDGSGSGNSIYVAGGVFHLSSATTKGLIRWTGSEWIDVGGGVNGPLAPMVTSLAVFDDGSGSALYAGGQFDEAGGVAANSIAKWNGSSWNSVGGGITVGDNAYAVLFGLTTWVNELYACGQFTHAGSAEAKSIAKWDGKAWSGLGHGIELPPYLPFVRTIHGGQGSLFVGGRFTHAGGLPSHNFAKWTEIDDEPVIVDQPADVQSKLGQPVAVAVAAWGGELSYQWRKDGIALLDDDHISGATTATLHIDNVTGDDAGSFDVVVASNCGEVTSEAAVLEVHCQYDIAPSGFANGVVDVDDLLMVINAWGQTGGPPADVNDDGIVDQGDLSALIAAWGECP